MNTAEQKNIKTWYEVYIDLPANEENFYNETDSFLKAENLAIKAINKFGYNQLHIYKMSTELKKPLYLTSIENSERK